MTLACRAAQRDEIVLALDGILDSAIEEYRLHFSDELGMLDHDLQNWWETLDERSQQMHLMSHLTIRVFDRMFKDHARIALNTFEMVREVSVPVEWLAEWEAAGVRVS